MRLAIRDFAGDLVLPGDPAYEDVRRTQDDTVDRRPAVIARCSDSRDVIAALRHARDSGLAVRVRGGGHGPDRFAIDDDAVVIDLSPMRAAHVDPGGRSVRVAGGATWRDVDSATQAHGLAVTGARIPSVGVAGFTLGSGSGWLERKLGLAADCLRCARVVTADARVVTASPSEHPDLFWALRGGGPSFGIVTELEFALHPIAEVAAGLLAWPLERAAGVTPAYADLMASAPDDLGGALALLNGAPFVPEPLRSAPIVAILVVWTGRGDAPIAPLRALRPAFDLVRRMPYAGLQGMFESPEPYTARLRGEGGFLNELSPEVVSVLAEYQLSKPAPEGSMLVQPLGGAVARAGSRPTPLGGRDAPWAYQAGAAWFDPAADAEVSDWAAGLRTALAPYALGDAWPNFIPEHDPTRLRAAYGAEAWKGLQTVRAEWDPDNVFSAGHSITLP